MVMQYLVLMQLLRYIVGPEYGLIWEASSVLANGMEMMILDGLNKY